MHQQDDGPIARPLIDIGHAKVRPVRVLDLQIVWGEGPVL